MNIRKIFVLCAVALFGSQMAFGQDTSRPGGAGTPTMREINERDFNTRREALERLNQGKLLPRDQRRSKEEVKQAKEQLKAFKVATAISDEDLNDHKSFLKQSDTGIFRIFPNFNCESNQTVNVAGDCKNFVPGTWAYSFRQEDHSDLYFNDLSFREGFFITTSLLTQGILVSLNDVPLEEVSLASGGIKYLSDFQPAENIEEARKQYEQIKKGVQYDGYTYSKGVKVQENTTYAVRVVAYQYKDKADTREDKEAIVNLFKSINFDKRKDLIVAFRVVERRDDGGVTILWKQLQEQKSPKIVYQKDEELVDFK